MLSWLEHTHSTDYQRVEGCLQCSGQAIKRDFSAASVIRPPLCLFLSVPSGPPRSPVVRSMNRRIVPSISGVVK